MTQHFIINGNYLIINILSILVRQENERLMQEQIERAKYAANFTEPPTMANLVTTADILNNVP